MPAFRSIVFASALAGLIVGLVVTVAQQFGTVPLILQAEVYEQAAAAPTAGQAATEHDHAAAAWEPADGFERNGLTALFNVIDWIGFGLMLMLGFLAGALPASYAMRLKIVDALRRH